MTGNQDYRTPPAFWDLIEAEFDPDIDVAATQQNCLVKSGQYFDIRQNALSQQWFDLQKGIMTVYCNPPFKSMREWVQKAYHETLRMPLGVVVMMVPCSTSGLWWSQFALKAEQIRFLHPRINFLNDKGLPLKSSNNRDNAILVFRSSYLSRVGRTPSIWTWNWKKNVKGGLWE